MSIFTGLLSCQFAEKKAADIASVHYVQKKEEFRGKIVLSTYLCNEEKYSKIFSGV